MILNLRCNKNIVRILAALLFPLLGFSQGIIDTSWPTGRINEFPKNSTAIVGDSVTIAVTGELMADGKYFSSVRAYQNHNLQQLSNFGVDTTASVTFGWVGIREFDESVYILSSNQVNGVYILSCYKLNSQLTDATLLFRKPLSPYPIRNGNVIDNEVFIMSSNGDVQNDTVEIEVFDLSGNEVRSKYYGRSFTGSSDSTFVSVFRIGPMRHPTKPEVLVFGNRYKCQTAEINKNSLRVVNIMEGENIDLHYGSTYIYNYELFPDRISCGGTVVHIPDLTNPGQGQVFQGYFNSRKWNGDSLHETHFGNLNVDERSYAYSANHQTNTHFLAAAAPFSNFMIVGAEYRDIVLHKMNQFGRDSINLYGNKNHVPMWVESDNQGNVFILSTYTDAWTTDSSYFTLTKIPGFAISVAERETVSNKIFIYPNPASDKIYLDELPITLKSLKVYDQTGRLVLQTKTQNMKRSISVSHLNAGVYTIVMEAKDGSLHPSVFQKL